MKPERRPMRRQSNSAVRRGKTAKIACSGAFHVETDLASD
jgi:hypothetical protein